MQARERDEYISKRRRYMKSGSTTCCMSRKRVSLYIQGDIERQSLFIIKDISREKVSRHVQRDLALPRSERKRRTESKTYKERHTYMQRDLHLRLFPYVFVSFHTYMSRSERECLSVYLGRYRGTVSFYILLSIWRESVQERRSAVRPREKRNHLQREYIIQRKNESYRERVSLYIQKNMAVLRSQRENKSSTERVFLCIQRDMALPRSQTGSVAAYLQRDIERQSLFVIEEMSRDRYTATHCNTLQHTATHCNTLQHRETVSLAD